MDKENVGFVDMLQAGGRYIGVLVSFVVAMLALLKTRDIAGMAAYIQDNLGPVIGAISGLITLGTIAFGLFKTQKRGVQAAPIVIKAAKAADKAKS